MTKYLAGVLTAIAAGVLLIAYGLLNPSTAVDAAAMRPLTRPVALNEQGVMQVPAGGSAYALGVATLDYRPAMAVPASYGSAPPPYMSAPVYVQPAVVTTPVARQVESQTEVREPVRRSVPRRIEAQPRKDWKRTAMIIGGSSAAGAGVGAIFGGKKGALIGAAIGGGASTIYQVAR